MAIRYYNKDVDIIDKIKKEQGKLGLTDVEFAKMLDTGLSDWSRFKNRKRKPSRGFLKKVANVLDVLKQDIVDYEFSGG